MKMTLTVLTKRLMLLNNSQVLKLVQKSLKTQWLAGAQKPVQSIRFQIIELQLWQQENMLAAQLWPSLQHPLIIQQPLIRDQERVTRPWEMKTSNFWAHLVAMTCNTRIQTSCSISASQISLWPSKPGQPSTQIWPLASRKRIELAEVDVDKDKWVILPYSAVSNSKLFLAQITDNFFAQVCECEETNK